MVAPAADGDIPISQSMTQTTEPSDPFGSRRDPDPLP
jgi:hypothetical protein